MGALRGNAAKRVMKRVAGDAAKRVMKRVAGRRG